MMLNERRAEIMRILTARRRETMGCLANELNVTSRTIRTDITALMVDYPLETLRGNGGCVRVADWYHPHRNLLSEEQQRTLSQLMESANEQQAKVLREMLVEYGSPKYRQIYEEDRNVRNITRVSRKKPTKYGRCMPAIPAIGR